MPRKGNAPRAGRRPIQAPDVTLRRVIEALERNLPRDAVLMLLEQGPWDCRTTLNEERQHPAIEHWDAGDVPATAIVGPELLAFLRSLVRLRGTTSSGYGIWVDGFKLLATAEGDHRARVCLAPQGAMRTAAILQFGLLLEAVGIANVQPCSAPDCPRLYVKTYRREFCSVRCQKRTYMRQKRAKEQRRQTPRRPRPAVPGRPLPVYYSPSVLKALKKAAN